MNIYTREVSTARFATFRRTVLRTGGAILQSAPVVGGYVVVYRVA